MPHAPGIQTDYVVEVITEVEVALDDNTADENNFRLISLQEFVALFKEHHPASPINPEEFWHTLFGNGLSGAKDDLNPDVRYLTEDSCLEILKHHHLFDSGIDFHHLPAGFILAKNPNDGGVRDVLHCSDYLAKNKPIVSPLAITLSPKSDTQEAHEFAPPQSTWYNFLLSKMRVDEFRYCTEKELKHAFISFSNLVRGLHLDFYEPNFNALNENVNPIVLLGRWATILTQPQLKKDDVALQWADLTKLSLTRGYGALRAITDYQNTDQPCGFILPEMFPVQLISGINTHLPKFSNIRTINSHSEIKTECDFWRYIAYQPKRNSIQFYKEALAKIYSMQLGGVYDHQYLIQILAACTTGSSQGIKIELEESQAWEALCDMLMSFKTSRNLALMAFSRHFGANHVISNVIQHLHRVNEQPNIIFLNSIGNCIKEHLESLNLATVLAQIPVGIDPLHNLVALSDKLNNLSARYKGDLYEGARFYFVQGKWNKLEIQPYIELQNKLHNKYYGSGASAFMLPYLSTFDLKKWSVIKQIGAHLEGVLSSPGQPIYFNQELTYCLQLFKDAEKSLLPADLIKIIDHIKTKPDSTNALMPLLMYIKGEFSPVFPANYFEEKQQQLIDAEHGLNEVQIRNVRSLRFTELQADAIIAIESALVRKNQRITTEELDLLNEKFVHISRIILPEDFNSFLEKLVSLRENLPGDLPALEHFISLLCQNKSLEGFSQIYFRNKIEKCEDPSLLYKFNLYIEKLKPLCTYQGTFNPQITQDLVAQILLNCSMDSISQADFSTIITQALLQPIYTIAKKQPHVLQHFLNAFNHIPGKKTNEYLENVIKFTDTVSEIRELMSSGEESTPQEMLDLFSILANFHEQPMELVKTLEQLNTLEEPEQVKYFLLLSNCLVEKKQSLDGLDQLVRKVSENPAVFQLLKDECSYPPYPPIKTLNEWVSGGEFKESYQAYSLQPYGERQVQYAFKSEEFDTQRSQFSGISQEEFPDELAERLNAQLLHNRGVPISELRTEFAELRKKDSFDTSDKIKLLCISIEMLARTTAQFDKSTPPKLISQELNTTQVLALYSMLTHPNQKLISQIDTGEGKSRIMMVLAACQVALGNTVDFMTSDLPLAERDFLTYSAFFKGLDIRTSLISLNTPKQLYQKGGVNFSDNSQLLLLRNRSDIKGEPFAYQDEVASKRCLLIDEVDKFTHDQSKDSFNFAAHSKKLKSFVWIYPLLASFVKERLERHPDQEFNAEKLTDQFVEFVAVNDSDELHQASCDKLRQNQKNQLVTWLNAAHTALNMKQGRDYEVTKATESKLILTRDVEGHIRYTRKVLVLDNGRPVEGSTFAEGVHQCLCAIENEKAGAEAFVIPPENCTQRSSYPKSFMSKYEEGRIFGVSGTTRSAAPSSSQDINYENYAYITVPRQNPLRREDKNVWAAKDLAQQIKFIKRDLREQLKQTPSKPVLLICKNDAESKVIHEALQADTELLSLMTKLTRVDALTEKNDEVNAIKEAGEPGIVTVSTAGMFARGVDINASNLVVRAAYIPTIEDEIQIKGRTGRFGKPGEYRMIINLSDPDYSINGKTFNIHNEINRIQNQMALNAVYHEEISKMYADFLENVHQNFLNSFHGKSPLEQLPILQTWQKFLGNLQKDWDTQKDALLEAIKTDNQQKFKDGFNEFTKRWEEEAVTLKLSSDENHFDNEKSATTIYQSLLANKGFFKPERQSLKVQRRYDVSDDGQARIYSSLFAQEIAILKGERRLFADFHAWRDGRGVLFPDVMATLKGERPLFANLRATIARLIAAIKAYFATEASVEEPNVVEEPVDGAALTA